MWEQDLSRGVRVYGSGPVVLRPEAVTSYYKYDSASRQFKKLTTHGFTVTTDAISVAPSQRSLPHHPAAAAAVQPGSAGAAAPAGSTSGHAGAGSVSALAAAARALADATS